MLRRLYRNRLLRRVGLPLLRLLGSDITIRHPLTGNRFLIHTYRHKGYWFHGLKREPDAVRIFPLLILPGDLVVEAGAHIGYFTVYLSRLTGSAGQVFAFEPGGNNLPYLRRNILYHDLQNIVIVDQALSDSTGEADFFLDNLSGQNNSLRADYSIAGKVKRMAFSSSKPQAARIAVTRLDDFCRDNNLRPDFVKIDAEGAEWKILQGMEQVLSDARPALMVEVTENRPEVGRLLAAYGYVLYDENAKRIPPGKTPYYNTYCLHEEKHRHLVRKLDAL